MLRNVGSKVAWVGRTASMVFGLALVLALLLGVATMALAGTGVNGVFNLGVKNTVDAVTQLVSNEGTGPAGPMLRVDNNSGATGATGLRILTEPGRPPMEVNSGTLVTNLNADKLDGQHASDLGEPRGYAHVALAGSVDPNYPSKGINGVVTPDGNPNVYCFDLTFTPKTAVGSPHANNNAVVATGTNSVSSSSDSVDTLCDSEAPHDDAVARTFAADTGDAAAINFQIVFE